MQLRDLRAELVLLAEHLVRVPSKNSLNQASRLIQASQELAGLSRQAVGEDEGNPEQLAREYLNDKLELFKKGHCWWLPPHNLALNMALLNWNLWRFTILPLFPKKKAYREDLKGIVIHPSWVPLKEDFKVLTLNLAERVVAAMQQEPTVQETVRKELDWIEREFSLQIPSTVRSQLEKETLVTARRRWGVDHLRLKNRLIPLDGSKARDLGAFE